MHQRQTIREWIVSTIIAAGTAAGSRVYENRVSPAFETELPLIMVYTRRETADLMHHGEETYERTAQVAVEVLDKTLASDIDDRLDSIAEAVENALKADKTAGGNALDMLLTATDIQVSDDGDSTAGGLRLEYTVTYLTLA